MYRCPICGELYETTDLLKKHDVEKHSGTIYSENFIEDIRFVSIINNIQQNINNNFK